MADDKHTPWHWPDHVIGKRESRKLREAHNVTVNSHAELLEACERLIRCLSWVEKSKLMLQAEAQAEQAIANANPSQAVKVKRTSFGGNHPLAERA